MITAIDFEKWGDNLLSLSNKLVEEIDTQGRVSIDILRWQYDTAKRVKDELAFVRENL